MFSNWYRYRSSVAREMACCHVEWDHCLSQWWPVVCGPLRLGFYWINSGWESRRFFCTGTDLESVRRHQRRTGSCPVLVHLCCYVGYLLLAHVFCTLLRPFIWTHLEIYIAMYKLAYVINNWVIKSSERVQAFVWCSIWETVTEGPAYHGCFWEPHWISMVPQKYTG